MSNTQIHYFLRIYLWALLRLSIACTLVPLEAHANLFGRLMIPGFSATMKFKEYRVLSSYR